MIVIGKMYFSVLHAFFLLSSIVDLRRAKQLPAFFQGFSTIQIPFFVRTRSFNHVLQQLRDSMEAKGFILMGPSGTGKSVSLIALFHYFLSDVTHQYLNDRQCY